MLKVSILLFTLSALLFTGCVNRRGISAKYYNDCNEYYDSKGYYHKDCDENIIEYEDVKKVFRSKEQKPTGNVW